METSQIARRYNLIEWTLDERLRCLVSAAEAKVLEQTLKFEHINAHTADRPVKEEPVISVGTKDWAI